MRLAKSRGVPEDVFTTLVGELFAPRPPETPPVPPASAFNMQGELIDTAAIAARDRYSQALEEFNRQLGPYETARTTEDGAKQFFRQKLANISSETAAISLIESAHQALDRRVTDAAADRFYVLIEDFIHRFNIRYEVRRPLSLNPSMSGVFSSLMSEIKLVADADAHIGALVRELEEAFADLRASRTQARMKTCLQKQYNLLEGLGRGCPDVTATTLGAICNQLTWPHETVKEVGKNLYRFGCDYPGVRHAGTPANALRELNMKDFLSLSMMLAAFAPYMAHEIDSDRCYSG